MNYEISVIIPTFNREKYIGRCMRSLLTQSIGTDNFEIIIIDDGSTDDTQKILNAFKEDIKILENKKNLGLPASLNKGIKACTGKYVVRVDSDDYVNKDFLKILYLFITHNKNFSAVACDYYLVDNDENFVERVNCEEKPIGCGIIFKKKDLISIGLYNEKFLLNEEKELRKRFENKFSIQRVPLPLYRYRKHDENMSNELNENEKN
ncbi:glycosyltransferase family 2 protein [Candidatus Pelagibacter sp.]|uniref:glycosyltransferase family 2 protein n=1 Tax=Candidatus Pelagibacter sp. TaxID=2024849 RepID=UPI003F83318C